MSRIEGLESRRLFAALGIDLTWGDDGGLDRLHESTFVAPAGDGFIAGRINEDRDGIYPVSQTFTRYTADGVPDPGYSPVTAVNNADLDDDGLNAVVDSAGQLYYGPPTRKRNTAIFSRYTRTGRLDRALGDRGVMSIKVGAAASMLNDAATVVAAAPAEGGGFYAAVAYSYNREATPALRNRSYTEVFKLTADGKIGGSFGTNARLTFREEGGNKYNTWLATDSAGRLLVGLNNGSATVIRRYAADTGAADLTFGDKHGLLLLTRNSGRDSFVLDANDRIIAREGTEYGYYGDPPYGPTVLTLRRYVNGRADASYGTAGVFTLSDSSFGNDSPVVSLLLSQRGGKVVVQVNQHVYRVTAEGRLDRTFDGDGRQDIDDGSDNYITLTLIGQLRDGTLLTRLPASTFRGNAASVGRLVPQPAARQLGRSGTLFIQDDGDDDIRLRTSGGELVLESGGQQQATFDLAAVKAIRVDLGQGAGAFDASALSGVAVPMTVYGVAASTIITGGGRDIVYGGATITTGAGNDYVDPGYGDHVIDTGSGNDTVINYADHDTINTGRGNDVVTNYIDEDVEIYLSDRIDLGPGDDRGEVLDGNCTIIGGDGDDTLAGGEGNDSLDGGAGRDLINGWTGNDTLIGGGGRDRLYGEAGDDRLLGGSNDDLLTGGPGKDTLFGEGGNDTLVGGPHDEGFGDYPVAVNRLDGGAGVDRYTIEDDDDVLVSVEVAG